MLEKWQTWINRSSWLPMVDYVRHPNLLIINALLGGSLRWPLVVNVSSFSIIIPKPIKNWGYTINNTITK